MLRYIKLFSLNVFAILAMQKSVAQISINGELCVRSQHQYSYFISGSWSPSNIPSFQWCVNGGTIVGGGTCKSATPSIQVIWDNGITNGDITLTTSVGTDFKQTTILNTLDGGTVSPSSQTVNYNTSSVQLTCTLPFGGVTCLPYQYQWEFTSSPGGTFSPVPGEISQNLTISSVTAIGYYRRKAILSSPLETYYSNISELLIPLLDAGTIQLVQIPAYNGAAQISATNALGGFCIPSNYTYQWEQSVEGGPWTVIGTTASYPVGAPAINGNTTVRRKITCGSESKYSNSLIVKPSYTGIDFENRNYIRSLTITTKGIQSWYQADQLDIGKKFQHTVYFDGLGRTIQQVDKGISSAANDTWKDRVSFIQYDNMGRLVFNNLPYATANDAGKFKTNTAEQVTYYSTNYGELKPWGRIDYEDNPLGRETKIVGAGDYRLTNNIGESVNYDFNNSNSIDEKVHIWRIGYTPGDLPVTSATDVYQAGTLTKILSTDDKGKKVLEYKDFLGNIILKKIQLKETGAGLTNEHDGWICTYYVYDDFKSLRFTITPKAVAYLDTHSWILNQAIADELCFYMEYDQRGRVITKKTPGAGKISMVFDQRDRIVMTQDGNQSNKSTKEWLVKFYDEFDRVILTGIYKSNKTRNDLQSDVDAAGALTSVTVPGEHIERLIVSERPANNPPPSYKATKSVELLNGFTSNLNDAFTAEIDPNIIGPSQSFYVTLNGIPPVDINDVLKFTALTYNYYDNYNFPGVQPFDNNYNNLQAYAGSDPDITAIIKTNRTLNRPTGSKVRVLGSDIFLISTVYYDEEGQTIQVSGDNYKGGRDVVTTQYNFEGRVMSTYTRHAVPGGEFNGFGILSKNVYDKIGRLKTCFEQYGTAAFKKIADYQYDEFGKLKIKKLGKKPNTTDDPLETLTYSYNARGVLTGINKDYALTGNNADQWNNYFGLYLGDENFDNLFDNARFDNLITGLIWKTQGDNTPRKYNFLYDNAGRYIAANFTQKEKPSDATWTNAKYDFSEANIIYDENGNLTQLYRKGVIPANSTPLYIDKLNYTYKAIAGAEWSNQLLKAFDNNPDIGSTANGKLGDFKDEVFNSNTDDYSYDANGNLVIDNNKKIKNGASNGIVYNFLDKPEKIFLENKSTVEFTYDAVGNKLAKTITPVNGSPKTTFYVGEFIYENDDLQYILNAEGRIRVMKQVNSVTPLGAGFQAINGNVQLTTNLWGVFDYFIKDHLGSVRIVLTEEYHKDIYKCTMENAAASEEEIIFGKVDNNGIPTAGNEVFVTRLSKNPAWSSNSSATVSNLITTTISSSKSIGPNVLLKVMGGDILSATANYFYSPVGSTTINNNNILTAIAVSIAGSLTGGGVNSIVKDGAASLQSGLQNPGGVLAGFLNSRPSIPSTRPKAYINYIFFDENFNYLGDGSGAMAVKATNEDNITVPNIRAPKNGYAYIYLSNESDYPVQFDTFTVSHERGAIIEESHYYPQGLKIAGLCSKAFNKLSNRYTFQGEFSEEEEETGYDEFDLRMYDPQIGRWIQADPYDEFASGYVGMGNDPVNNVDPSGGLTAGGWGAIIGSVVGFAAPYIYQWTTGDHVKNKGWWGLLGSFLGAGIGYAGFESLSPANGESYTNQSTSFFSNLWEFYVGLAGNGNLISQNFNNNSGNTLSSPDIWGIFSKIKIPIEEIAPPIYDRILKSSIVGKIGSEKRTIKTPDPGYHGYKFPPPRRRRLRPFPLSFSDKFMNASPPTEKSLSIEEINSTDNAIRPIIRRLGRRCISYTIDQIIINFTYPSQNPLSTVVQIAGGNSYLAPGQTKIRTDEGSNSSRPWDGTGQTPYQNYLDQARGIGERIARRLGASPSIVAPDVKAGTEQAVKITVLCRCVPFP